MYRNRKPKTWTCASEARRWLLVVSLLTAALPAFAEYFVIKDYGVDVRFDADGTLQFTETILVEFLSERHGIFRAIPLVNKVSGKRRELILSDISVDGWPMSRSREGGNLILKIGDPDRLVSGTQRYVLRYKVRNGLHFFASHTEFYWDLLGIAWEVPVEQFHFTLQLPTGITVTDQDLRLYTGPPGSTASDAEAHIVPSGGGLSIQGQTSRAMDPHEAVTIAIRLPKNAFPEPNPADTWFILHGLLLLPIGLVIGMVVLLLYSRNRSQAIVVEYWPPTGILPVVAGGFIDHHVDNHDVLSLLPLLAYKGYLRLEMSEEEYLWVLKRQNTQFIKLKEADSALSLFERTFMDGLFAGNDVMELDSLKNRFYKHLNTIREQVKDYINDQQWYEADQRTNRYLAVGAAVVCGLAGGWSLFSGSTDFFWYFAATALLVIMSRFFNKRNAAGNSIYRKLEGFRRFMVKVERPMLERLLKEDPQYFDKTLPYAVAFGEVEHWTGQFEGLLAEPPQWYGGPNRSMLHQNFSWSSFSSQFNEEMNTIDSVFGSSPSSSGSGGSSGGGSGGGGGGSW